MSDKQYIMYVGEIHRRDQSKEDNVGELILHDMCGPCGGCMERTFNELNTLADTITTIRQQVAALEERVRLLSAECWVWRKGERDRHMHRVLQSSTIPGDGSTEWFVELINARAATDALIPDLATIAGGNTRKESSK